MSNLTELKNNADAAWVVWAAADAAADTDAAANAVEASAWDVYVAASAAVDAAAAAAVFRAAVAYTAAVDAEKEQK